MYSIYALTDPRDDTVRYVGLSNNVARRLAEHYQINALSNRSRKRGWIENLKREGLKPLLAVIETVETLEEARLQETHWINHYTCLGMPLVNALQYVKGRIVRVQRVPHSIPNRESYLTKEVAEMLGLHPKVVNRLIHCGELEAFMVGSQYRIKKSVLDRFMNGQRPKETDQGD